MIILEILWLRQLSDLQSLWKSVMPKRILNVHTLNIYRTYYNIFSISSWSCIKASKKKVFFRFVLQSVCVIHSPCIYFCNYLCMRERNRSKWMSLKIFHVCKFFFLSFFCKKKFHIDTSSWCVLWIYGSFVNDLNEVD